MLASHPARVAWRSAAPSCSPSSHGGFDRHQCAGASCGALFAGVTTSGWSMLAIPLGDEAQTLRQAWQIASDPPIEGDIEALRTAFWSAGQGAALGRGNCSALSSCQQIFMQTSPLAACVIKCFGGKVPSKGDRSVWPWMDRGGDHEPARCVVWQFFRTSPWVLVA
jgi:hypothetical protein